MRSKRDASSLAGALGATSVDELATLLRSGRARHFPSADSAASFDIDDFEELLWCQEQALLQHLAVHQGDREVDVPRRPESKDLFRWAIDRHGEGHTLRYENAHTVVPCLASLAADTASQLLSHVSVDAVLLASSGVASSHGMSCASRRVVVQTAGTAAWTIAETARSIRMKPGDALYVPSDRQAECRAESTYAVLVVLTIEPLTAADLLDCLVEVATELDPALRFTLRREAYADAVEVLSKHAASSEMQRRAWERVKLRLADEHRPGAGGHLAALHAAPELTSESRVETRPGSLLARSEEPTSLYVFVPGLGGVAERDAAPGGLIFPLAARPLLEEIANRRGAFSAKDLSERFTVDARLATVRRLAREGVLTVVAPTPARRTRGDSVVVAR
ncbi:MAG: hypothetical protein HOW73_44675 [Polyangiaceae bacterium]|nr:hypothetical protein [Polyangiaceae bacterium]